AFHDLQTGIALRPAWGPMFGAEAVSEQQLAEAVMERAPAGSVIVGDGNFGVFSVAYAVAQHHQQVLFRLTKARAQALGAGELLWTGARKLVWYPRRSDRNAQRGLPQEGQIEGRVRAVTCDGIRETFYLFTILVDSL